MDVSLQELVATGKLPHVVIEQKSARPPKRVILVPWLAKDLEGLKSMVAPPIPPKQVLRSPSIAVAYYGFGDASGAGYGSSFDSIPDGPCPDQVKQLKVRFGLWGRD